VLDLPSPTRAGLGLTAPRELGWLKTNVNAIYPH
jgi:hypothetical protein